MKLLISAGEPSGDQRGAEVLAKLKEISGEEIYAFGLGGKKLGEAGLDIKRDMTSYAVMGFTEIAMSLSRFLALERYLTDLAWKEKPQAALLVDYPGFNMRLGRKLRKMGIPVIQYVAPQMWAWGDWRVKKLKNSCDLLLSLFQFEETFFRKRGLRAVFTGHPLKENIQENPKPGECLGLLPGSRAQEVKYLLPPMLRAFEELRDRGVISSARLAVSDHLDPSAYLQADHIPGLSLVKGSEEVLKESRAALVCSGTATLEAALHNVPFVVCYRTSMVTYTLARILVRGVKRIGMANIVAGCDVAPELIQRKVTTENIISQLLPLLETGSARDHIMQRLPLVRRNLGEGDPAGNAAGEVLNLIRGSNEP